MTCDSGTPCGAEWEDTFTIRVLGCIESVKVFSTFNFSVPV